MERLKVGLIVALLGGPTLIGVSWLITTADPTSAGAFLHFVGGALLSTVLIPLALIGLLAVLAARVHDRQHL